MKQFYALILFFSIILTANAQTNFIDGADMPSPKSAISSASDGSHIYVTNGFGISGGYTSEVYKFDISTNSWSILTSNTIGKRFGSTAYVGNDILFIFNGYIGNNVFNDAFEVVDLSTGNVADTSLVNPQPAAFAGVAEEGNIIYSFGGETASGYSNKLYAINTATLTINELTSMPIAAQTKGEVVNGKLYVIGGFNGSVSDKIYVYDIATDTWTDEYNLPQGLSANATAVVGTKIYVVGDFTDQTFTGFFDTTTNMFTETTSNLISRRHAAAEGVNGDLYVMGGNTTSSGTSAIASLQSTNITLSTEEYNFESIFVYPNPTDDWINFQTQVDEVELLNFRGSVVRTALNTNTLNVEDLQDGIYILKFKNKKGIRSVKLIKQ